MAKSVPTTRNRNLDKIKILDDRVDELVAKTDELENKVQKVVQYYESYEETDGSHEESVQFKRMQNSMQQFRKILGKIMNHKWAFPFLKPVNAWALGLYDYHEIIRKPMDMGTILKRMEAKEESDRYKNVSEICDDVRLVFTNAMTYNDPGSHAHIMAQELSYEFERMWHPLSLKVAEEEIASYEYQVQKAATEKLAQDADAEIEELSMQLKALQQQVKKSCRQMSIEEKLLLMNNLVQLSVEEMNKAVEIAAKYDPDFEPSGEVGIEINSLNVIAKWMVFNFIEKCMQATGKEAKERKAKRLRQEKYVTITKNLPDPII